MRDSTPAEVALKARALLSTFNYRLYRLYSYRKVKSAKRVSLNVDPCHSGLMKASDVPPGGSDALHFGDYSFFSTSSDK